MKLLITIRSRNFDCNIDSLTRAMVEAFGMKETWINACRRKDEYKDFAVLCTKDQFADFMLKRIAYGAKNDCLGLDPKEVGPGMDVCHVKAWTYGKTFWDATANPIPDSWKGTVNADGRSARFGFDARTPEEVAEKIAEMVPVIEDEGVIQWHKIKQPHVMKASEIDQRVREALDRKQAYAEGRKEALDKVYSELAQAHAKVSEKPTVAATLRAAAKIVFNMQDHGLPRIAWEFPNEPKRPLEEPAKLEGYNLALREVLEMLGDTKRERLERQQRFANRGQYKYAAEGVTRVREITLIEGLVHTKLTSCPEQLKDIATIREEAVKIEQRKGFNAAIDAALIEITTEQSSYVSVSSGYRAMDRAKAVVKALRK